MSTQMMKWTVWMHVDSMQLLQDTQPLTLLCTYSGKLC